MSSSKCQNCQRAVEPSEILCPLCDPLQSELQSELQSKIQQESAESAQTDPLENTDTSSVHNDRKENKDKSVVSSLPWGKTLLVGVYCVAGLSLLTYDHLSSEQVQIERHLKAGEELLGERLGVASTEEELLNAAEHYLAALSIHLHVELAQRRLDIINRRLAERRKSMPEEMKKKHVALSSRARLEQEEDRRGFWGALPITPGERFKFRDRRTRIKHNSYIFFGGLTIMIGWMLLSFIADKIGPQKPGDLELDPPD